MSKRRSQATSGSMLELWRPPEGAGDPVGCLATTYEFDPAIFDEQCLAHFLEVDSDPDREDLAYLLERESRLGSVYAGVLVDRSKAGVEHSMRWDVLAVRIPGAIQHAKLSLLVWAKRVRVVVASANLTTPGYRTNFEVAVPIDMTPEDSQPQVLADVCEFMRSLLGFVPGASPREPDIKRALAFLDQVERQTAEWIPRSRSQAVRQRMVFTLPGQATNPATGKRAGVPLSTLDGAVDGCRYRGGSPNEARIASPFFDVNEQWNVATQSLCKALARGGHRWLSFCVPAAGEWSRAAPRLAAPRSLLETPKSYGASVSVEVLPQFDAGKNPRPWHAKMLALRADGYSALVIGSSNFTSAGLGLGTKRNAEANVLTIADRGAYAREPGELEAIWPEMQEIGNPEDAEWLGSQPDGDEKEVPEAVMLPLGFLSAVYRAGDTPSVVLRLDKDRLPAQWAILTDANPSIELLNSEQWAGRGKPAEVELSWESSRPPGKLVVRWGEGEAYWSLNVEDSRRLPPPEKLEQMSADDMLHILGASDPGAAARAWAKRQQSDGSFDDEHDAAVPVDLDPLRRHDLQATFLHRVRRRARVLASLRANLERPVWSLQGLQWRLSGSIGVEALAHRFARELTNGNGAREEAALTLADLLIVLREIEYSPRDGALPKPEFNRVYGEFLFQLVGTLDTQVQQHKAGIGKDVATFWDQVVKRCRS